MPAAKTFFRAGGTMDPRAPSYLERGADADLFQALSSGEYAYVLDARQFGKSSLVARTMVKLREAGITTIKLDLQRVGANVSPEQFYGGLLDSLATDLDLCDLLFAHWRKHLILGPLARMFRAIEDVLISRTDQKLVVIFDEIDYVRALSFSTDELFAKIRDCHNRRADNPALERLTFCLVGVATPGQLVQNPEITPFNIGRRIELRDFSLSELAPYGQALDALGRDGRRLTERVFHWVEGHPYLTQLICSRIESDPAIRSVGDVDALIQRTLLTPEARQTEPNLADVERRMLDSREHGAAGQELRIRVLELYGRLLSGHAIAADDENPVLSTLRLSGLTRVEQGRLRVRNRLYRTIFSEAWRRQNLPDFEVRRVRAAARRSVLRTASAASLVLTVVSALAVRGHQLSGERQLALGELSQRTDDLKELNASQRQTLDDLRQQEADLSRLSADRQKSIEALEARTKELREVSRQREQYLAGVTKSADELRRLNTERVRVIQDLGVKTSALTRQTYNTRLANISLGLQMGDSRRVTHELQALAHIHDAPFELGHARLLAVAPDLVAEVPRVSSFEIDEKGALAIASSGRRSRLSLSGIGLDPEWPPFAAPAPSPPTMRTVVLFRRGKYRVWRSVYPSPLHDWIVDASTNRVVVAGEDGQQVADISSDGTRYLARRAQDKSIHVKDLVSDTTIRTLELEENVLNAGFTRSGGIIAGLASGFQSFDAEGVPLARASLAEGEKAAVLGWVLGRGKLACAVSRGEPKETWVEVRDAESLRIEYRSPVIKASFERLALSEDATRIAAGASDGRVFELGLGTHQPPREVFRHSSGVWDLVYHGGNLYTASHLGDLAAWRSPVPPARWTKPDADARVAAVVKEGRAVVWIDRKWTWHIEDFETGERRSVALPVVGEPLTGPTAPVATIGGRVPYTYFPGPKGSVGRLHHDTLRIDYSTPVSSQQLTGVSTLDGGRLLCWTNTLDVPTAGNWNRSYAVLDSESMSVRFRYDTPFGASFGRGGHFLQLDSSKTRLVLRSQANGEVVHQVDLPFEALEVTMNQEGTRAAVAIRRVGELDYPDAEIWLFELPSLKRIGTLRGPRGPYWRPALSPDGRRLWAMNNQGVQQLFDVNSQARIRTLGDSTGYLVRNTDGSRLAAVVNSRELRVWDTQSGDELMSMPITVDESKWQLDRARARFSADGKEIAVVGDDGAVHVFLSKPISPKPAANTPRRLAP